MCIYVHVYIYRYTGTVIHARIRLWNYVSHTQAFLEVKVLYMQRLMQRKGL